MTAFLTAPWNNLANVRVILGLAVIFGLVSAQAGRGTLAYFTDVATSNTNTFTTGTIDIALANGSTTPDCDDVGTTYTSGADPEPLGAVLTAAAKRPGDVSTVGICVKNASSTLATQWSLASTVSDDATNTNLQDVMKIRIWALTDAAAKAGTACGDGFTSVGSSDGTGADLTVQSGYQALLYGGANGLALTTAPSITHSSSTLIAAGAYQKACFSVVLPTTATDSDPAHTDTIQGKTVTASFTFTGNQTNAP